VTIVCLGWGSLVWKPDVLRCESPWHSDGPMLPLEFARVSRDGRLTLVLVDGSPAVPCLWCELDYVSVDQAQIGLAGREGCDIHAIGRWPGKLPTHSAGADAIARWAVDRGVSAVLWTALPPKFGGRNGQGPASAEHAIEYLAGLGAEAKQRAEEYVRRAPAQIKTSFRTAFIQALGWTSEDTAHA
jgi:hypothetical protein